ncbi:MAG: protein kinase [Chloroflexota bacterium]
MEYLIGQTLLGRYDINKLLGKGGMGAVFQARDQELERDVAIKLMHPEYAHRPDFTVRFRHEAIAAARMDHPGIVKVHDFSASQPYHFLVMEFIPGVNLRHMLQRLERDRQWITLAQAVQIVCESADALAYAHQMKVLHRDIKPANIMLKEQNIRIGTGGASIRPVITDLGLAKLQDSGLQTLAGTSAGGTPAYMSPEQAQGQPVDARSDVYSLGVLLFELALGRRPFPIQSGPDAVRYHVHEPLPQPSSIRPDVDPALETILQTALAKRPHQRYPSAAALADALQAVNLDALATSVPPSAPHGSANLYTLHKQNLDRSPVLMTPSPQSQAGSSTTAQIRIIRPDGSIDSVPFAGSVMRIGRGNDNDVVLSDSQVSRHHALVERAGRTFRITDQDSGNGVMLGHQRIQPNQSVRWMPDRALRIGSYTLFLQIGDDSGPQDLMMEGMVFKGKNFRDETPRTTIEMDRVEPKPQTLWDRIPVPRIDPKLIGEVPLSLIIGVMLLLFLIAAGYLVSRPTLLRRMGPESTFISEGGVAPDLESSDREDIPVNTDTLTIALTAVQTFTPMPSTQTGTSSPLSTSTSKPVQAATLITTPTNRPTATTIPTYAPYTVTPDWTRTASFHQTTTPVAWATDSPTSTETVISTTSYTSTPFFTMTASAQSEGAILATGGTSIISTTVPILLSAPMSTPNLPALSSLDGYITFVSDRHGNDEIYVMNADGSNPTRLTNNEIIDRSPSWSPDGSRITFSSNRDGNYEIYVMNADGSNPIRLTNSESVDLWPRWSPDGSRIIFVSNRDGNRDIYVMNADGSNPIPLTTSLVNDEDASWSPDGSQIAFSSNRDGNYEIYVMNADGSEQTRLTNELATDWWPRWSPDGSHIIFHSDRDNNWEIYVMNTDGSEPINLTNNKARDMNAIWSPDGSIIAFNSERDGNYEIYMMNTDGSMPTNLTNNRAEDYLFDWNSRNDEWQPTVQAIQATTPVSIATAAFQPTFTYTSTPSSDSTVPPQVQPRPNEVKLIEPEDGIIFERQVEFSWTLSEFAGNEAQSVRAPLSDYYFEVIVFDEPGTSGKGMAAAAKRMAVTSTLAHCKETPLL